MPFLHTIWFASGFIFLINLPFGSWRARSRKFSPSWFVAVHLPVLLAIGFRVLMGIRFMLATIPVFVAAFFLGQSVGGRFQSRAEKRQP
jgi:hypothetical protein